MVSVVKDQDCRKVSSAPRLCSFEALNRWSVLFSIISFKYMKPSQPLTYHHWMSLVTWTISFGVQNMHHPWYLIPNYDSPDHRPVFHFASFHLSSTLAQRRWWCLWIIFLCFLFFCFFSGRTLTCICIGVHVPIQFSFTELCLDLM